MKKFMNAPRDVLAESLRGFADAHADIVELHVAKRFIQRKSLTPGKVGLVSGGGAGHEPLHVGFVGRGMLDAACVGQIFSSPTADQIAAATHAVDTGAGIVFIVKNYDGDRMNFQMARELADRNIATVITSDDVSTGSLRNSSGRRGVAGTLVMEKLLGAAAEKGANPAQLQKLATKVNRATRSMGVALTSCTVPEVGLPTFDISISEMEIGVGIHGEPGRERTALKTANDIADQIVSSIVAELPGRGAALVFVNGFGGTPSIELYLMFNAFNAVLQKNGIRAARCLVGNYVTSLDMAGCSLTVSLFDDEMVELWDAPVHTAALQWKI